MLICCFDAAKLRFLFESEEPKREKCRSKRENSPFSPFWLKRCGKKGCHACNGVTLCRPTLGFHIYIAYAVVLNLRAVAPLAKGCHSVCRLPLQYPHSAVVVDGEGVGQQVVEAHHALAERLVLLVQFLLEDDSEVLHLAPKVVAERPADVVADVLRPSASVQDVEHHALAEGYDAGSAREQLVALGVVLQSYVLALHYQLLNERVELLALDEPVCPVEQVDEGLEVGVELVVVDAILGYVSRRLLLLYARDGKARESSVDGRVFEQGLGYVRR